MRERSNALTRPGTGVVPWSSRAVRVVAQGILVCGVAGACAWEASAVPAEAGFTVSIMGGDAQRAPAGNALPQPLTVVVREADGMLAKGARVVFRVVRGGESGSHLVDSIAVTSSLGVARAELELGSALDTTIVIAFPVRAPERAVTFVASASAAPNLSAVTPLQFGAGDTITLRGSGLSATVAGGALVELGAARAALLASSSDSVVRVIAPPCLAPGTTALRFVAGAVRSNVLTAEYRARRAPLSLAPLQSVTVLGAQLQSCMTLAGSGAIYLLAAQFAASGSAEATIDWRLGASVPGGSIAESGTSLQVHDRRSAQRALEVFLRATERDIAPQARAEAAGVRGAEARLALTSALPALGTVRDFKVLAALAGTAFTSVHARLRYAGAHLLVYADTLSGGFTDDQYRSLGTLFDRDLYGIDVAAFGSESDVDGNGRVIALFTPAVNKLVRAQDCVQFGYVTGFFYGLDLLADNPNSNRAEIFYSFIPDSTARFSCAHTTREVLNILPGTFVHELQHMISFNQHVFARLGPSEDVWLNEGLSHMAEELASRLYEARYPPPLGRLTAEQIYPDSAGPFIAPQLLNAYVYLNATRAHSVTAYSSTGSVEERGATWLFLKWLNEQKGDDILRRLVQTSKIGISNVEAQSNESFSALFGDFSTALWVDSLPGLPRSVVPSRFQFGARSLRRLMAREAVISGFSAPFPLTTALLTTTQAQLGSMLPGTMSLALLQPAAGGGAVALQFTRPDLSALGSALGAQVTIFRLP